MKIVLSAYLAGIVSAIILMLAWQKFLEGDCGGEILIVPLMIILFICGWQARGIWEVGGNIVKEHSASESGTGSTSESA